jgi:hypothetical protein
MYPFQWKVYRIILLFTLCAPASILVMLNAKIISDVP